MLRNYLTIAFRNLRRQAAYAAINVSGLGLGLACCFLIVLFVQHERSFDRFHAHKDRIYRVISTSPEDGKSAITPAGLATDLEGRIPEVEAIVRVMMQGATLKVGDAVHRASDFAVADPSLFRVFDFPLRRGDPATALESRYGVVLSASAAERLFDDANPIGAVIRYGDRFDLTVTGVMEDTPTASHLQIDYVVPIELLPELWNMENALQDYANYDFYTYFLLDPGARPSQVEAKLEAFLQERFPERTGGSALALQPLTDIHFTTDIRFDVDSNRDPRYLYLFGVIGLFILGIACINFMNLATARATKRAREVGVRKTLGARRRQLVGQFLGEAVMLSVLGLGLAFALAALFLPTFNAMIGSEAQFGSRPGGIVLLVGIGLAAGVLAGSYPAFYLSSFDPAAVLKRATTKSRKVASLRKGLIVVQFAVSVFLIIGTFTVYNQLQFMRDRELGFAGEQVIFAPMAGPIGGQYEAFRQELLAHPRVQHVTRTNSLPGRTRNRRGYVWIDATGEEQSASAYTVMTDADYVETLGLTLKEGRDFSRERASDAGQAYIVNEAAVRALGIEAPIGHPLRVWDREAMGQIIGVVEDFHFKSLHQEVEPIVINLDPWAWYVAVRVAADAIPETVAYLRTQWEAFAPGHPFEYRFLDADFDRLYRAEEQLVQRFAFFAAVAIFIACLGLFGVAAYSAEQRRKEIGIRKALGASVSGIVGLFSKEFALLVGIAFFVAAPVGYLAMQRWLEDFAYRVDLGVGLFAAAGTIALAVALLTVSVQALRAARTDPVNVLRYE